jgi:hypothetical protein
MLGGVDSSTVSRWASGKVTMPGPAKLLLLWIIKGINPFGQTEAAARLQGAMWRVEMSLEAYEQLDAMRISEGYATLTDWIAASISEKLPTPPTTPNA